MWRAMPTRARTSFVCKTGSKPVIVRILSRWFLILYITFVILSHRSLFRKGKAGGWEIFFKLTKIFVDFPKPIDEALRHVD